MPRRHCTLGKPIHRKNLDKSDDIPRESLESVIDEGCVDKCREAFVKTIFWLMYYYA
jgi:hypothetical protein